MRSFKIRNIKITSIHLSLLMVLLFLIIACDKEDIINDETNTNPDVEVTNNITDGFVLYSFIGDTTTHLIDSLGADVKTWSSSNTSAGGCYLSVNKNLLRLGKLSEVNNGSFSTGGLVAGVIEELDDNNKVVWSIERFSDASTFHHDFKEIDANTIIALSWELREYNNSDYWNELIVMIDKTDNSVIWNWSAMDDGGIVPENKDKVDYLHFNSIDYKNGEILISSKNKNTLYIINKESKKITKSLTADETLVGQHDATFLENGNILVFNNNAETNKSAILEITKLDVVVWEYSNSFYSDHISGVQRLDSGNTLICSGVEGQFIEVTEKGEEVWSYIPENVTLSKSSNIFKARKYADY
ncbi:Arylsulfotransferase (ASST) [Polaribacter sp. KT25b]|uniref:arylsulfotransferase family protein n=1 Tax=Polaribacter sp. KT25b TaxID=1855336 RepID=UPI00087A2AB7|nr:arylsulfotransferase family protein [Polaribacter sp. KT25b]SDS35809.1 Arylsulfotransferase (ASST) [Polaribacter sp. KT25b]